MDGVEEAWQLDRTAQYTLGALIVSLCILIIALVLTKPVWWVVILGCWLLVSIGLMRLMIREDRQDG